MSTSFIAKSHLIFALTAALFAVTLLAVGPSFATEVPTNALCPITPDEPVDPTIFSDYEGQRIYFCCQRCRRQFEASPAKYLPNLVLTTTESTAHGHGDESPEDHHKNTEGQASSMAPPAVSQHADAEDDGHQHDHASDHALENEAGFGNRLLAWLGRFHPVIIHFPIALLIAGAIAECLHLVWSKDWLTASVRFVVLFAAASAVPAAILGWLNAAYGSQPEDLAQTLFLHRWIGTTAAVLAVVTAVLSERSRRGGSLIAFRVVLLTTAALIGLTGHLGGTLIFGEGYFAW